MHEEVGQLEIQTTPRPTGRLPRVVVRIACLAAVLLAVVLLAPTAFGIRSHVVADGAMGASIALGSVVLVEEVPVGDLRVGDVITYAPPADAGVNGPVTRRIVSMRDGVLVTRGDASPEVDPWTTELSDASQARVVHHLPHAGHPFLALAGRGSSVLLVGVPAALVVLVGLTRLVGDGRRPVVAGAGTVNEAT